MLTLKEGAYGNDRNLSPTTGLLQEEIAQVDYMTVAVSISCQGRMPLPQLDFILHPPLKRRTKNEPRLAQY